MGTTSGRTTISVLGVGAIGGAVAADLADLACHDLRLCFRSPVSKLVVSHPDGDTQVDATFLSRPSDATPSDWVLLATKAHQSASAQAWLDALCQPGTTLAVLQNGVDHVERISKLVPDFVEVIPVVVQLPAEKLEPGRVVQSHNGGLTVPDAPSGRAFAALFEGARTRVRVVADFRTQAWWKLVANAALGGVCALTLRENGVAARSPVRELVLDLMREVATVGRAEGAALPDDAPEKALAMMLGAASDHWTSIAVDRREGQPMEWRVRNEVVVRLARVHGIATPLNNAITALLCAADVETPEDSVK